MPPLTTWPKHWRCRVEGSLLGDNAAVVETFSFGWNVARTGGTATLPTTDIPSERDYIINQALPAVRHIFGATLVSNNCVVNNVKFNKINNLGHYFSPVGTTQISFGDSDFGAAIVGGGGALKYPFQIAQVISLLTAATRGPAHHGRFFLPCPTRNIEGNGRLAQVDQLGYANISAQAMAIAIATLGLGADIFGPVIVSPQGNLEPGGGTIRPVTAVRVGRVLDTMRSRRRSLQEDYASVQIVGG